MHAFIRTYKQVFTHTQINEHTHLQTDTPAFTHAHYVHTYADILHTFKGTYTHNYVHI